MVKLKKIDLTKGDLRKCEHPDIKEGVEYLALIDWNRGNNGRWYAGKFTKQHYGWNFDAVFDAGYQLSYSGWLELYEIVMGE